MDLQENRGWELVVVFAVFISLSWVSVLMRCYTRLFLTKAFQVDDWLMVVSIAIFTIMTAFILVGVNYGLGAHNATLSRGNEIQALKYQALATALYIANLAFIKLSIITLLLRIAVQRRYIWILRMTIAVIAVWSAAIFIFDVFQCKPVAYQWNTDIVGGICIAPDSIANAAYSFSVMAIISDWLCALLPIPMIWNIQLNRQTKVIVAGILSLGIFASIATLIRIKYLITISDASDVLFSSTDAMIWTAIETGLGITAASIVTLRPLLRALRITGFSSTQSSTALPGGTNQNGYVRSVELPDFHVRSVEKERRVDMVEGIGNGMERGMEGMDIETTTTTTVEVEMVSDTRSMDDMLAVLGDGLGSENMLRGVDE